MTLRRSIALLVAGTALLSACVGKPAAGPSSPPSLSPPAQQPVAPLPVVAPPIVTPPVPVDPVVVKPAEPAETPIVPPLAPARMVLPEAVRGIQVTGWVAGLGETLDNLLTWARGAGINAVVLDLKAEDGKLSWNSDIPLAREVGANVPKVADLARTVARFREQGFWVIGRIVVFNDPVLYRARPEWGIPGFDGRGYSFLRPMEEQVWDYNLAIAQAAAAAGVNEIQFDYIRFPERWAAGYNLDTTAEFRTGFINGFLRRAVSELKPQGLYVSAAIFGLTTSVAEGDDMRIGQDYRAIAEIVDFVSAMIYPSHFARGTYGLEDPDRAPYETIKRSMERALLRTDGVPIAKHRPWIQDFTYPAPGYHKYGKEEVEAQIQALAELGIKSYLLWDPASKFSRTAVFHPEYYEAR
jgi:hypothetical protein